MATTTTTPAKKPAKKVTVTKVPAKKIPVLDAVKKKVASALPKTPKAKKPATLATVSKAPAAKVVKAPAKAKPLPAAALKTLTGKNFTVSVSTRKTDFKAVKDTVYEVVMMKGTVAGTKQYFTIPTAKLVAVTVDRKLAMVVELLLAQQAKAGDVTSVVVSHETPVAVVTHTFAQGKK